ncbi:uncharacterized protein LAESUDRAFT_703470 [Laetiporus sulphureus 93-53]|uniref:WW domain-containing protein n=1 Tax=Laetiporus sulphureus 93-53 TaxID=1314785 RepID=A0A165DB91_9APHY|nr:uncharacterized protein LAESUDRAFT_703470 [Laetiporus sulphureus 93-53]KZT04475.1 hypothetical protein LAESUDRAFT_703470 [Laetiporus sulphureus 93-53]
MQSIHGFSTEKPAARSGSLRPTTSLLTVRYGRNSRATRHYATIAAGFGSYNIEKEPISPPHGCSAYIHPEGQLYFACATTPPVVTEAYLYSDKNQEAIVYWIEQFNKLLDARRIILPKTVELFLQLSDESDDCLYYLVDYATHVAFWIEDEIATEDLWFPEVASKTHLRIHLTEQYWAHVEYFSAHRCSELSMSNLHVDELATVFLHGRADRLTSATSTFPYDAAQCSDFLEVLNSARTCAVNAHTVTTIARLWVIITHYRFNNLYGDLNARLSSDQSVLELPVLSRSRLFSIASQLLFKIPDAYEAELESLWVDELVHQEAWRAAAKSRRLEWALCSSWAFALLIVNLMLLMLPSISRPLAFASILMCNISVVSSAVLLQRNRAAPGYVADQAVRYLTHGFRSRTD